MIRKSTVAFWLINIFLPLLLGLVLYLLYRPDTYISRMLFSLFEFDSMNFSAPQSLVGAVLVSFIRNFLCDMLWAYALTFTCIFILGLGRHHAHIGIVICLIVELCVELFQKFHLFHGTFDKWDVILEFIATLIAALIIKKYHKGFVGGLKE